MVERAMTRYSAPMVMGLVAVILGAVGALSGCTEANPAYQGGPLLPGECRAGSEVSETFENFERPEKVDLLFVVPGAGDIVDFQNALSEAAPGFLEKLDDEEYDIRMGVKTADATAGAGLAPVITDGNECGDNDSQVADNGEDGWLVSAACNLRQGIQGERRQQPLDVLYESVVEKEDALQGFRREDARLVMVILANEDDCSGEFFEAEQGRSERDVCAWQAANLLEVEQWAEAIRETASVPEGISLAVIAGPPVDVTYERPEVVRSVCRSTLGSSYPSTRLYRAAEYFGEQGLFLSSCVLDFSEHLEEISKRLVRRDAVTLCPAEPLSQEPLEVSGAYASGGNRLISFGSGFVFLGPVESCENGAIRLRREGSLDLERVDIRYCTD